MPFPSPGTLSDPGIKPGASALQTDSLATEPPGKPICVCVCVCVCVYRIYTYMCVYKMQTTLKKNPKAGRQREKGSGGGEPRTDETNRKQIAR